MSGLSGFGGGSGGGSDAGEATSQSSSQSSQQQQQQQQQSQVKLDMTVKLDIEARQPSDLLLRLQPFLSSSSSQEQEQQEQQQQQGSDEGGLELNLGLSLGGTSAGESPVRKAKKGAEFLQQEQQQKGEFLRGWSSNKNAAAGVAEEQNQVQNSPQQQQQQQQVLLRPTSNPTQQQQVAGREHAAKLRKKRRLLIDECRRSGLPRPGVGAYRRCRPPASPPTSRLAPLDELKPSPAEVPSDSAEDTELRNVRGRLAVGSAAAGRVKLETGEGAAESSKVIRPSPIHESKEWVQKFLEMRSSEPSTSPEGEEESKSRRLSGPSTSSSLENPAFPGFDVKSPDNSSKHRLMSSSSQDCSRPSLASSSLFRSTSLGSSFASFKSDTPTQQKPSPVATRTDNSAGVLLRTFSEGSKLEREISFGSPAATPQQQQQQQQMQHQQRPNLPKLSAFKSPKKEPVDEDPGTSRPRTGMKRSNSAVFAIGGQAAAAAAAAARASLDSTRMYTQLPLVSTTGTGPNGKTVSGVLFAYRKGDVKIICACHGRHMTAREFVEHAGGVNVTHPEKCIVVNPSMLTRSRSMINNMPATTAPPTS